MNGSHFICLKSSKDWGCRKDYIYVQENDELVHYSSRWQTRLLNADLMLGQPGLFSPASGPFGKCRCDCDECRESRDETAQCGDGNPTEYGDSQ